MKKTILSLLAGIMMIGTPATFTSCDENDVQTIMNIIEAVLSQGGSELVDTNWYNEDSNTLFYFGKDAQGIYAYPDENGVNGVSQINFSYSYDSNNNTLTITYTDGDSEVFTVVSYKEKSTLVLQQSGGATVTYQYITE